MVGFLAILFAMLYVYAFHHDKVSELKVTRDVNMSQHVI